VIGLALFMQDHGFDPPYYLLVFNTPTERLLHSKRFFDIQQTWTIVEEHNTLWRSAWEDHETCTSNSILVHTVILTFVILTKFWPKNQFHFSSVWKKVSKTMYTGSHALSFPVLHPACYWSLLLPTCIFNHPHWPRAR